MDCVPMRMPLGNLLDAKEEVDLITAPDITAPDHYLTILQETGYEFSLEKWVLTGLQGGYPPTPSTSKPSPAVPARSPSEAQPSCPPYWMMFSSPQQSRLASRHRSDFWEPDPRQRSHSLDPKDRRSAVNFAAPQEKRKKSPLAVEKAKAFSSPPAASLGGAAVAGGGRGGGGGGGKGGGDPALAAAPPGQQRKGPGRAFTPDLLNPPACLSSLPHQRRKNLRQCYSLSGLDASGEGGQKKTNHGSAEATQQAPAAQKEPTQVPTAQKEATQTPTAQRQHRPPTTRANTVGEVDNVKHNNKLPPSDCSVQELLGALSPDERALLGAVTDRGYPLREAFVALQRTGQRSPEQVLSYMVACDRLCELGYDEAQVEEALEMFQNCEAKAREFLRLLRLFNEMGFQQNAIKEVLLVHDNHWERALEELMHTT